jgi:hypothetical protein
MVLQTGASEAEHLLSIAKDSYTSSDKDVADVTSSQTTCEETSCLKKKFENIEENGQLVNMKDLTNCTNRSGINNIEESEISVSKSTDTPQTVSHDENNQSLSQKKSMTFSETEAKTYNGITENDDSVDTEEDEESVQFLPDENRQV